MQGAWHSPNTLLIMVQLGFPYNRSTPTTSSGHPCLLTADTLGRYVGWGIGTL